ncbi:MULTISPECIES: Na(+)/H(+) antiporter subunit F1 [Bacillaceae]|uniref:Na(+)/H(+) antiporter subunit F1 n=1 Tax=Evansella alkalicola TaxID=745819 RepID=A0ABS6JVC6_9BACI|nr:MULTISPECIES: Na(+)/H(+) antiporter subunit F1 [Bacillaceae]MBU9722544.1 Na(+)/H(+) antiporter subunit F1 [Bacillus alkalicola]
MLQIVTTIVLILMSLSIATCFYRVVKGPTMSDRVVALDTIGINLIGFIGVIMIIQNTLAYSDVILVIAILAFIGSIALAKFIEGGIVLDRDNN